MVHATGEFKDGAAHTRWTIVPDSATGDLKGIRGQGRYTAQAGAPAVEYHLEYEIS